MAAQDEATIVATEDVLAGKPRVKGRRIGVRFLAEQVEGRGLSVREVADRYDLPPAAVYRALAYYHEHPEEMAAIERRRESLLAELEADPDVPTTPDELAANTDRGTDQPGPD